MIKIFDSTDTSFNTNGNIVINPLKLIETKKKSLNGWYINVEIPIEYKEYIQQDKLCVVKTKSKLRPQAFRIGNIEYTQRKIIFTANHVVFDAKDYFLADVRPTELNALNSLKYINERTDNTSPFNIVSSDIELIDTCYFIRKNLLEAWTIIEERYNGIFDADNFDISFNSTIGIDRGEIIVYKKNLQNIKIFEDWSNVCTRIYPVGKDGLMLDPKYIDGEVQYDKPYTKTVDFETKLNDEDQTEDNLLKELEEKANKYLLENQQPLVSYEITSDINQLMEIGDKIHVKHPIVNILTEVLEYEFDGISKRVKKIVFGNYTRDVKAKFDNIKSSIENVKIEISNQNKIINKQTEMINSLNKNGYVYIDDNEILILDALPKEDAINVWRFGLGGLGFSSSGYKGPFETAITADGSINADFISTGTLAASRVEGYNNLLLTVDKMINLHKTITGTEKITLENAYQGILHKLTIKGNVSLNFPASNDKFYGYNLSPSETLVPSENLKPSVAIPLKYNVLYPSDTLYPKKFILKVDDIVYDLDVSHLSYINSDIYDEFVYENGHCYVIRRVGFNEIGEMYKLEKETIEEKNDLIINVSENSTIKLIGFENAILSAEYLLKNQYTDVFATEAYVNSEIKQTTDEINLEVRKKVNDTEVISTINQSPEQIALKGNRIIIESDNFELDSNGKITSTAGEIGGFNMDSKSFFKNLGGIYNYNQFDAILTGMSVLKRIATDSHFTNVLDANNDDIISSVDYMRIKNIINGTSENTKLLNGSFEINSFDPKNCISIKDDTGEIISSLGLGGINSTYITCNNFVCGYPSDKVDDFIGASINGSTGVITCASLSQTSQEKYKKNFEKLENALDIIKNTDIYKYNLKTQEDNTKKHIGFVIGDNYKYSQEITTEGNDCVDTYSMVSVCFKAIQEQQEQIKSLKNEINQLKEMIK